jgi:hypothetical protein
VTKRSPSSNAQPTRAGPVRDALIAAARAELSGARRGDAVNQFLDALGGIDLRSAAEEQVSMARLANHLAKREAEMPLRRRIASLSDRNEPSLFDHAVAAKDAAEPFSDPVGEGAKAQTEILDHDLQMDADRRRSRSSLRPSRNRLPPLRRRREAQPLSPTSCAKPRRRARRQALRDCLKGEHEQRCIPELQGQNKLSRDQAERVGNLYDDLERDYSTKFGKQAAEAMASEEAVKRFEAEAAETETAGRAPGHGPAGQSPRTCAGSKDNPGAAAEALLASDDRAPYFNVEFRSKAIANEHFAMMNGILEKHSRNVVGQVRDVATLHDVVGKRSASTRQRRRRRTGRRMARHGGKPEAALQRCRRGDRQARQVGNAASPQHARGALVPFEQWRDFIRPLLDPNGCSTRPAIP